MRHFAAHVGPVASIATEFCEEYQRNFGVDAKLVVNASSCADLNPIPLLESGQSLRLVHAGAGRKDRYLKTMIDSVVALPGHYTSDMYSAADNAVYITQLGEYVVRTPNVWVLPGIPYHELIPTLNRYDLGIHNPPPVNFNSYYVLPNEFFNLVQAHLGMVAGPNPEMVSRLDRYHLGRAAADLTAEALWVALEQTIREEAWQWKQSAVTHVCEMSSEAIVGT